jgi:hypothetical protein
MGLNLEGVRGEAGQATQGEGFIQLSRLETVATEKKTLAEEIKKNGVSANTWEGEAVALSYRFAGIVREW